MKSKYSNHLVMLGVLISINQLFAQSPVTFTPINPEKITIVRDTLGIAHIFAKTDAEVAYGFAWSNAEDNFKIMQETLVIGKGLSGRYEGKKGAPKDFLNQALGIKEAVDKYYGNMTPAFLKYLDGYCQGINAYAAAHKKEIIIKGIFPLTSKDILRTYTFISCFLAEAHKPISNIIEGKYDSTEVPIGSNAYAVSPYKSADGRTYLSIIS